MHSIETLHLNGTEIKFPVGEDRISKRGYITTCKHTKHCGRNVKGDSQRERGVWCFSEVPWRVAPQRTLHTCSTCKFLEKVKKKWLNPLWLEVWALEYSLHRREKGNTLSSFFIQNELLCRSNQAESCVVQR